MAFWTFPVRRQKVLVNVAAGFLHQPSPTHQLPPPPPRGGGKGSFPPPLIALCRCHKDGHPDELRPCWGDRQGRGGGASSKQIGDTDATALFRAALKNHTVTTINVSYNELSPESAQAIRQVSPERSGMHSMAPVVAVEYPLPCDFPHLFMLASFFFCSQVKKNFLLGVEIGDCLKLSSAQI